MPACGSATDFLDIWTAKSSDMQRFFFSIGRWFGRYVDECMEGQGHLANIGAWAHLGCIIHIAVCCVADIAFVDRADIKAYVGPPTLQARYEILRSCLQELLRTGILSNSQVKFLSSVKFVQRTGTYFFSPTMNALIPELLTLLTNLRSCRMAVISSFVIMPAQKRSWICQRHTTLKPQQIFQNNSLKLLKPVRSETKILFLILSSYRRGVEIVLNWWLFLFPGDEWQIIKKASILSTRCFCQSLQLWPCQILACNGRYC